MKHRGIEVCLAVFSGREATYTAYTVAWKNNSKEDYAFLAVVGENSSIITSQDIPNGYLSPPSFLRDRKRPCLYELAGGLGLEPIPDSIHLAVTVVIELIVNSRFFVFDF